MIVRAYGEWIARKVFGTRAPADPESLPRSLRLLAASTARIPDQNARRRIAERISSLPFFKRAVQNDEAVNNALGLSFVHARVVGSLTFALRDYIDAVRLAERGRGASVADMSGRTHEVRAMCLLQGNSVGVGLFRGDELAEFDGDWRSRIPDADDELVRQLVGDNRIALELSAAEALSFAEQVIWAEPQGRLRVIDDRFDQLINVFLLRMRDSLKEGVQPQDVMPLSPRGLAEYVALEDSDDVDLSRVVGRMLARMPALEVFERLAGLPVKLPESLLSAVEKEARDPLRLAHAVLRTSGTPVSMFHALRVAIRVLPPEVGRRVTSRVAKAAIDGMKKNDFQNYLWAVQWFADELWRRPESQQWSTEKRAFVAWVYAHQVMRILADAGYDIQAAASILTHQEGREEVLFGPRASMAQPYSPRLVGPAELVVCALADAIAEVPELISESSREQLNSSLRVDFETMPWEPSIFNGCDQQGDDLGSYFSGDRVERLRTVLGELFTDDDAQWFGEAKLIDACRDAVNGKIAAWSYVASRLNGSSVGEGAAEILLAEVLAADARDNLLRESRLLWCLRLATLARVAALCGDESHIEAMWNIWDASVALATSTTDPAAPDIAMSLIQAASALVKAENRYPIRIALFSSRLKTLAEGSEALVDVAGVIARRLMSRLPAHLVTHDLARAALVARFRGC